MSDFVFSIQPMADPYRLAAHRRESAKRGRESAKRERLLTRQIVVRVDEDMYDQLALDADANGRTVAQSVRWLLRVALYEQSKS